MQKLTLVALAVVMAGTPLLAQDAAVGRCVTPDTFVVAGNKRVSSTTILLDAGLAPGVTLSAPVIQRAIKNVFQSGQFDDVRVTCAVTETVPVRATMTVTVAERPILDFVDVSGPKALSIGDVRQRRNERGEGSAVAPLRECLARESHLIHRLLYLLLPDAQIVRKA